MLVSPSEAVVGRVYLTQKYPTKVIFKGPAPKTSPTDPPAWIVRAQGDGREWSVFNDYLLSDAIDGADMAFGPDVFLTKPVSWVREHIARLSREDLTLLSQLDSRAGTVAAIAAEWAKRGPEPVKPEPKLEPSGDDEIHNPTIDGGRVYREGPGVPLDEQTTPGSFIECSSPTAEPRAEVTITNVEQARDLRAAGVITAGALAAAEEFYAPIPVTVTASIGEPEAEPTPEPAPTTDGLDDVFGDFPTAAQAASAALGSDYVSLTHGPQGWALTTLDPTPGGPGHRTFTGSGSLTDLTTTARDWLAKMRAPVELPGRKARQVRPSTEVQDLRAKLTAAEAENAELREKARAAVASGQDLDAKARYLAERVAVLEGAERENVALVSDLSEKLAAAARENTALQGQLASTSTRTPMPSSLSPEGQKRAAEVSGALRAYADAYPWVLLAREADELLKSHDLLHLVRPTR